MKIHYQTKNRGDEESISAKKEEEMAHLFNMKLNVPCDARLRRTSLASTAIP